MFNNIGIITNCWQMPLEKGASFDDLAIRFCAKGFNDIEIRDGDYLRTSSFAGLLGTIEETAKNYSNERWQRICDRIHQRDTWHELVGEDDLEHFNKIERFIHRTNDAIFSLSMSHPWLSEPVDLAEDERKIETSIKTAYLLNPSRARLRLVSLEQADPLDRNAAVSNLKRYRKMAEASRVVFTVENAFRPAPLFLELARSGGVQLAYDEANNHHPDGTVFNTAEEFWKIVRIEELSSIHIKQKDETGLLPCLGEGLVDLRSLLRRLDEGGYRGDLLLEFAPTEDPLADAVSCREYILNP
jgi:sugar phosphate isomerase/epimerase